MNRQNVIRQNVNRRENETVEARVVAVSISAGGVPKLPVESARVTKAGLQGDRHAHAKHNRADRAISIFDIETLGVLVREGFALRPGTAGENLTVRGLNVQSLPPGALLGVGEVVLRLEEPRRPCYVLDVIDPRLQHAIAGRCGYMASVICEGTIEPGMPISRLREAVASCCG